MQSCQLLCWTKLTRSSLNKGNELHFFSADKLILLKRVTDL